MPQRLLFVLAAAALLADCNCGKHGSSTSNNLQSDEGIGAADALDFGNLPVGQTRTLSLNLSNTGAGPLGLTTPSITGTNAGDFALLTTLPASLEAGQVQVVGVTFTPSAAGPRSAALNFPTNSTQTPTVTAALSGVGVDIEVCAHPTTLDFGPVQVKGTPVTMSVSLGNCGQSPFDITFSPIQGTQAGDFTATGNTAQTLQPGQSVNLQVAYAPQALGTSTADLPYGVCQGCPPETLGLTGVGVDCAMTFNPSPDNFGTNVPTGKTVTNNVTATNTGTESCTVNTLGTFNNNSVFVVSGYPTLPITLTPTQSFSTTVAYTPSGAAGGDSDQLLANYTVADPAVAGRTAQDLLSGDQSLPPCSLTLAPPSLGFGNVAPNSPSTKQVTLDNTGSSSCAVSAVALGSGTDPYFSIPASQPTAFAVAPGATATISVEFDPTSGSAPLSRKGTLTFQTGDPTNPSASVPLLATISNSTIYSGGWPKWHHDNFNSGQTEADTSALAGTTAWKFNVGAPVTPAKHGFFGETTGWAHPTYINSPVVDSNGNVYQIGLSGTFYALTSTGTQMWTATLTVPADPHPSTPAILASGDIWAVSGSDVEGGFLKDGGYAPNNTSALFYLSAAGSILYQVPYGSDGFDACPGLANDGTLFEGDDDGSSVKGSGASGDPYSAIAFSWNGTTAQVTGGLALPLSIESERFGVVIGADDTSYWGNNGQFFAVSPPASGFTQVAGWPAAGVTLASNATAYAAYTGTAVVSDLALDSLTTGYLYAYSAWEDEVGTGSNISYTVQGTLVALDPATGVMQWTLPLPLTTLPSGWAPLESDCGNASPAVADDGTVYVGNGDGLRSVAGATGAVNWLFASANVSSSPAIGGDGTVFFGTDDGSFYAVYPNGTLRFKISTGGPISASPAISGDGTTVYFTSDDGNLYAIH